MPTMPLVYVVDTSILVDLYLGGLLDDLFRLPFRLFTADVIVAELLEPDGEELVERGLSVGELNGTQVREVFRLASRDHRASTNDFFALVLARSLGATLLTGDKYLSGVAQEEGVPVHGVLWVLDELVRLQVTTPLAAAEALRRMLTAGSRLPRAECQKRLKEWAG